MQTPGRILVIRLSSVGDVVLATPIAGVLKHLYPKAHITWLVDADYVDLVRNNPDIDRVVGFDYMGKHRGPSGIRVLAEQLRPVDLLIDLQHKVRSVMVSVYLRPAQRKVWIKRCSVKSLKVLFGKSMILRGPHQVKRYLSVLEVDTEKIDVPLPFLRAGDEHRQEVIRLLEARPGAASLVALIPGGRHATKRWPLEYMTRLADIIQAQGHDVIILGSSEETSLIRAVASGMKKAPRLAHGGSSLGVLAGLISSCRVVVSPDSGPAHMAAALKVPVVTLFGPTSPERWAPLGQESRVLSADVSCSPCSNYGSATCPVGTMECMRALDPDHVWLSVKQVLAEKSKQ